MEKLKKCTLCKEEKPTSEFGVSSHTRDGLNCWCKGCRKVRDKEYSDRESSKARRREREITGDGAKEHRSKRNAVCRKYRRLHPERMLFIKARGRARKMGLDFDLSIDDISIPEKCPVLGIDLFVGNNGFTDNSPTLDRVDTNLGYVRGNVVVVSWRANALKRDASVDEMRKIVAYMESQLS